MKHFLIFGNHPRIALAEYRIVTHAEQKPILVDYGAIEENQEWDGNGLMDRLAGTVKLGDIVNSIPSRDIRTETFADIIQSFPRGSNIAFGFTVLGGTEKERRSLLHIPIALKQVLKDRGIRCRWVTSKDGKPLTPAAVAKLNLTTDGYDFVVLADRAHVHIGLTTHVQNADAWSERDYGRPVRDETAGMLPPKLARILVNLADIRPGQTVLDPFCGNGTVLMEAALATQAARIIGTDIDAKQTASSTQNIEWLITRGILSRSDQKRIEHATADARFLSKRFAEGSLDRIVTEGSLGPPLKGSEDERALNIVRKNIEELWTETLRELHPLLSSDGKLIMVWPSFRTAKGSAAAELSSDTLAKLGYDLIHPLEGWENRPRPLLYHREGQKIARRILVLRKRTI
ncbi:hypothetical protein KJZ71_03495 [Patescibacteria group bacterium]|uniref:Ribosomal RNA large subunit methyltransferase K/L-like methyltransferase domain-containing protein n=1 Tax=candidate division WWE3 bacterium TaxID=2053526 RepID=A0A928Y5K0_UNCKA|nr:hypothetical protein [candidate division WWE3 bacterium]MCL4732837.1 hypothetical protein [Patescibacteria group bacterium]